MSTEPERPIEKLLRECAQKRCEQAGAPFEMHPATRKLLQGEVARQFSKGSDRPELAGFWRNITRYWPRIAWSVGVLAIMGITAWLLFPSANNSGTKGTLPKSVAEVHGQVTGAPAPAVAVSSEGQSVERQNEPQVLAKEASAAVQNQAASSRLDMALADSEKAKTLAQTQAMTWANAASSTDVFASTFSTDKKDASKGLLADSSATAPSSAANTKAAAAAATPSPAPVAGPEAAAEHAQTTLSLNRPALPAEQKPDSRLELAARSTAPDLAASAGSQPAVLGDKTVEIAATSTNVASPLEPTQSFRRLYTVQTDELSSRDTRSPAQLVLARFQFKQTGQEIQIVDEDGSVYTGSLLPAEALPRSAPAAKKAQSAAPSRALVQPSESSSQAFSFGGLESLRTVAFRVTGTNVSLNERVVFTGNLNWPGLTNANFSAMMQGTGGTVGGGGGGGGKVSSSTAALDLSASSQAHFSGKLTIGDRPALDIQAVPAKP